MANALFHLCKKKKNSKITTYVEACRLAIKMTEYDTWKLLPDGYWVEVVHTSMYLLNRSLTIEVTRVRSYTWWNWSLGGVFEGQCLMDL